MGQVEEKRSFFDGRLLVYVPGAYQRMDAEKAEMMYPYADRPQIILEDEGTCRWCTFSLLKEQRLSRWQIEDAIRSISRAILSLYPSCAIREPELMRRRAGDCGWFAFRTAWDKGGAYNIMYVYSVDGVMMLGTLGCRMEDAQGIKEMMEVIRSLEVPVMETPYRKAGRLAVSRDRSGVLDGHVPLERRHQIGC